MSIGYSIAIAAVPFFDLLDGEEGSLAAQVLEAGDDRSAGAAVDATRRRLALGVDAVVRSLPTAIRSDLTVSRAVAYALIGLADERMLHHPAGGLDRWRERLLEFDLYGSALAGQEIVSQARNAAHGVSGTSGSGSAGSDAALLAPLYLGVFRAGFEGSLRGDAVGLSSLVASLEEAAGTGRERPVDIAADVRPTRIGLSPVTLVALGLMAWLVCGPGVWYVLAVEPLKDIARIAERVSAGLPASTLLDPLERSVGPSGLPPLNAVEKNGAFQSDDADPDNVIRPIYIDPNDATGRDRQ